MISELRKYWSSVINPTDNPLNKPIHTKTTDSGIFITIDIKTIELGDYTISVEDGDDGICIICHIFNENSVDFTEESIGILLFPENEKEEHLIRNGRLFFNDEHSNIFISVIDDELFH